MRIAIRNNESWAVLASGPSLTAKDIGIVKQSGVKTIAVNTTIFAAPWADICFALDQQWWNEYQPFVEKLGCRKVTSNPGARNRGIEVVAQHSDPYMPGKACGKNSGHKAITLAILEGATEIILLGFDCMANGHHHSPHPDRLGSGATRGSFEIWRRDFSALAEAGHGVRIVNCSRETTLTCFPRQPLEAYLWARKRPS